MIRKVAITQDMIDRAQVRANQIGKLKNSIRGGKGNFIGCLGEEAVASTLPSSVIENTYDYDIVCRGVKIDVKTKERTVDPRPYYEQSVADFNTEQRCDAYVFVSITMQNESPVVAHILGGMPPEVFYNNATKCTKGQVDTRNNFTFKADCYNISIAKILEISNQNISKNHNL